MQMYSARKDLRFVFHLLEHLKEQLWVHEWVNEKVREWLTEWICVRKLTWHFAGGICLGIGDRGRGSGSGSSGTGAGPTGNKRRDFSLKYYTNYANAWELCLFHPLHYNNRRRYPRPKKINGNIFLFLFIRARFFLLPVTRFCALILSPNYLARSFVHSQCVFAILSLGSKGKKIIIKSQKQLNIYWSVVTTATYPSAFVL